MKFAHLADSHIGGWREEKLKQLSIEAFKKAVDHCIDENVAFLIIAGDLFNTSIPQIDQIKETAKELARLKEHDIDVYIIPGSHDFSPSGKTMIDVLERSGLCNNVFKMDGNNLKFTKDKTGVKLTGILGLRAGLDREFYSILNKEKLEKEDGFKIFLFHTTLEELKPKSMEKVEGERIERSLPRNFNYYAGGHVHIVGNVEMPGYGKIVYPGPLFPNNFHELEELKHGGFYIVDDKLNMKRIDIKLKETICFNVDVNMLSSEEAENKIIEEVSGKNINDAIVTLRVSGILRSGKPHDISFKKIIDGMDAAYIVLKNTAKLSSKEFEEVIIEDSSVENVENKLINEAVKGEAVKVWDKNQEMDIIGNLINVLDKEKGEGERNVDFEDRLFREVGKVLKIE
jgi:DNA repair protein SbcD/Mre11